LILDTLSRSLSVILSPRACGILRVAQLAVLRKRPVKAPHGYALRSVTTERRTTEVAEFRLKGGVRASAFSVRSAVSPSLAGVAPGRRVPRMWHGRPPPVNRYGRDGRATPASRDTLPHIGIGISDVEDESRSGSCGRSPRRIPATVTAKIAMPRRTAIADTPLIPANPR